ncbi:PREDICTED: uncharacterized protein LOC109241170 [Nicotiana attenuata]|uniref:uncharacterized protein LOC109241170 n=1 Tax=Nicotiana attenuata TaxID=49451 RepID=UPI000905A999|nr:PREDICTED: uncharacterized protein LOC109241170 [Nicotiana attenuata]
MHDYSLFYKKQGSSTVFVAVYVDDILLIRTDLEEISQLKAFLHDIFKIKDLGQLHYFLRLEVLYKEDGIIISQRKFVLDLLKEYDCLHSTSLTFPLDPAMKLKAKEGSPLFDSTFYRRLVGKLNFLTNTILDIAYGVQHLRQIMQDPREPHLHAAYHMLRYLKKYPTLGLYFSNASDLSITAYCDSDWAACPDSRRSVSGYIVLIGGSPVSWKSKKQETISLSSAEEKYIALRKVSALHIARNLVFRERTKHVEVDCHFVRTKLQEGLISLHHIGTIEQLANVLTKALAGMKHSFVLGNLVVITSPPT